MTGLLDPAHYVFNFYALPPFLVGGILFLLGAGTLIWEHGEQVSRSFFLMTLSTAVWLMAYGIAYLADDAATALVWVQISHFGVSLIPSFIFLFALILTGRVKTFRVYAGINFFISVLLYFGGLWTHSWIAGVTRYFWGYYARYGPLGLPFILFFSLVSMASLALLWKGYRDAASEKVLRRRLKVFLMAFSAGYLASVDYLAAFGVPVYPFGYLAVVAFIVMTAYAIRRYHLIDITPAVAAQQILGTMQGAVLVTDLQGAIRVVNKAACRMFGYEEAEILGMPIGRIIETPLSLKVGAGGRDARITSPTFAWSGGEIRNHGSAWRAKTGKKIQVSMSASPLRGAQDSVEGMVFVALDITELRNTEEILKESEERFRSITESANDAIVSGDSEGNIISWNGGALRIFGYEEEEVIGKPLTLLMPERYREAHRQGIKRLQEGGASQVLGRTLELSGIRKSGEEFPLELSLSSWKTAKGIFYSGIMRDISGRKRLAEERDRFFSLSVDLLCISDFNGYFKQLNPAWEKTLGWSVEELMAKPFIEFIHPDDRRSTLEEGKKAAKGEVISSFENRYLCKDGSYRWLLWNAMPVPAAGLIYGAARDITERKKAREMRLRLASIVESTDDSILSMTLDGTLVSWNRGAEKIYGYLAGVMIGQSFIRLIPNDYSEEIRGILNRIWEGGRLDNYETKRLCKDGRLIDVSLTLSPIKDDRGKITGISSIGRDITKLKQAEEALRQKKDLEIKSGFVSMVSHELRTPLTAIKMGIDILIGGEAGPVAAEQKEWLEMAQRNVERLTRLINNVLDFQKLDAGQTFTDCKEQALNELIRELEMTLRSLAHHKNLAFDFELAEDLPKVSFDREKITEVLMNLVSNAVKFTDQGKICLKTERKENQVEVSVTDTGIGIQSQDMTRLFKHFIQLHGDHAKTGGTGLGLAISKKIIDQHGGVIGARSEYGKGSTFYFRLPIPVL